MERRKLNCITIPIMLFLLCILLGISTKRIFHFRKEKCKVFYMNKYQFILFIAFITMVVYQIGYVVFFQHADIDDSIKLLH